MKEVAKVHYIIMVHKMVKLYVYLAPLRSNENIFNMFHISHLPLCNGLLNMNASCYVGSCDWKEKRLIRKTMTMVGL